MTNWKTERLGTDRLARLLAIVDAPSHLVREEGAILVIWPTCTVMVLEEAEADFIAKQRSPESVHPVDKFYVLQQFQSLQYFATAEEIAQAIPRTTPTPGS